MNISLNVCAEPPIPPVIHLQSPLTHSGVLIYVTRNALCSDEFKPSPTKTIALVPSIGPSTPLKFSLCRLLFISELRIWTDTLNGSRISQTLWILSSMLMKSWAPTRHLFLLFQSKNTWVCFFASYSKTRLIMNCRNSFPYKIRSRRWWLQLWRTASSLFDYRLRRTAIYMPLSRG